MLLALCHALKRTAPTGIKFAAVLVLGMLLHLTGRAGPEQEPLALPFFGTYRVVPSDSADAERVARRVREMGGEWKGPPAREVVLLVRRKSFTKTEEDWLSENLPDTLRRVPEAVCHSSDTWRWPIAIVRKAEREDLIKLLQLLESDSIPASEYLSSLRLIFSIYATNYFFRFVGAGRNRLSDEDKPILERSLKVIALNGASENKVLRQWSFVLQGFLLSAVQRVEEAQKVVSRFKDQSLTWEIHFFFSSVDQHCSRALADNK